MAVSLTLTVGALTRTATAGNDTKAQDVLLKSATAIGVPADATNAERADAILVSLRRHMVATARDQHISEQRAALLSGADDAIQF